MADVAVARGRAPCPAELLAETGSTNEELKLRMQRGAAHGALLLAERQTGGRGRLGRAFASPPGGLYMSMGLRCEKDPALQAGLPLLTAAAAVAVCEAVQVLCGLSLSIKWVNDLFWQGRKCCGILAEGVPGPGGDIAAVVVGIGLNYTTPDDAFPPELAGIAGALFPGRSADVDAGLPPPEQLAADIHARLLDYAAGLQSRSFLLEYRRRNLLPGRAVIVLATPPYEALAVGIDDDARLVVRTPAGAQTALAAGEVALAGTVP